METPEHAWHYTTAHGLLEIVRRHRIWATSAAYMNDRNEIREGRDAIRRALEKRRPQLEDWQLKQLAEIGIDSDPTPISVFLLSAALDGDSLTLWRSYGAGGEAEYAIDFDPIVSMWPVVQNEAEQHPEPPPGYYEDAREEVETGHFAQLYDPDAASVLASGWGKVEYLGDTSRVVEDELQEIIDGLKKPHEDSFYVMFSDYQQGLDPTVFFKQPGFSDENEVRSTWRVEPWWRFVLYRVGRFGIAPYVEVSAKRGTQPLHLWRGITQDEVGLLPIRSVRIGPTRGEDDAEVTLRALLDAHGYGHVEILRSSTPYR
ncbi:hypothetical protein [Plantibacter sp. CFBP 8775]|uniref:hypothetical protein n=1 Tax=Plantibacter sp. CFBP 8775 TaxID=2774038 RepID=UPI00177A7A6C|nr:hypothetical protein [Plantibacter sp. CFBP 8775]MBD8103980.1 hypothetical protein [Plantibacter sp. CFBP 8775]